MSSGRPRADVDRMTSLEVDNLPHRTSPDRLWRIFRKYGRVGDVYIPRVPYSKEALGFALVRLPYRRDAQDSEDALDGDLRDGRDLRCTGRATATPGTRAAAAWDRRPAGAAGPATDPVAAARGGVAGAYRGVRAGPVPAAGRAAGAGSRARSLSPSRSSWARKSKSSSVSRSLSRSRYGSLSRSPAPVSKRESVPTSRSGSSSQDS